MNIVGKIQNRIQLMIGRALLQAVNDSTEIQLVKLSGLDNEVTEGVEHIQAYGLTSNAPSGSEMIVLYPGGRREDGIVVAIGNGTNRPKGLESGEVSLWSKFGQAVKLNKDAEIEIGGNADFAVAFNDLKIAFDSLKLTVNTHTHICAAPTVASATALPQATASVDGAKVSTVLLP